MAQSPEPRPGTRRSWGRIALIAVLVLSLLGNAVALGALIRFREVQSALLGPEAEAGMLPAELRRDLRTALRAEADEVRPLVREVVNARAAVVAAATAQPYDRAATEAAMLALRGKVDALLAKVQRVFLDRLDQRAGGEGG